MESGENPGPLVTDATVYINFARVHRLDLLSHVPRTMWCPEVVWQQTLEKELGGCDVREGMEALRAGGDLRRKRVEGPQQLQLMNQFLKRLDEGEADVLALAVSHDHPVATDDLLARKLASKHRVRCTGTIGILFSFMAGEILTVVRGADLHDLMREEGYFSPFQGREDFLEEYYSRTDS